MRYLMWFTIGFAAACALGVYLVSGIWLGLLCAFAFVVGISFLFLKSKKAKIFAIVLSGLAVGLLWTWGFDAFYLQAAKQYDGETATASVTVSDYSYETTYGVAADGEMTLEGKRYNVRVYVTGERALSPGDEVIGDFRLRLTTDDSLQGATYHQGNGIFLLAYANEGVQIKTSNEVPLKFYPAKLRRDATGLLDAAFPEDTLAFARALLLGDSSLLSYEMDTAFKLSGIRHVIAVSGLHVSILFSLVYFVSGRRRISTAVLGIPVLILFAAIAGFTPSIVRACIMQGLVVLGLLFNKEYDPPTALSFAVLTMLAVNPLAITSVSFQMSVGCLIGILMFYQKVNDYFLKLIRCPKGKSKKARFMRWLCGSVAVTLSAMVFTTPLSALYFGTVSLVSILTNLLALWVISFAFYGIMLSCAVGAVYLPAAKTIAWVVSWPIRYVLMVAKALGQLPFSAVYTCSVYIVVWLVFCYVLLGVFILAKKKRPGLLTGCILVSLAVALGASYLEPKLDNYRGTVFDGGQGQSILIQCDGKNYLVDCGGDNTFAAADDVAGQLLSQGITRLDGLILTHYDLDHIGGVTSLLSRIDAKMLYLPDILDDNGTRREMESSYADSVQIISRETVLTDQTMRLTLFPAEDGTKGNESCMCILFQTENCDILISGDRGSSGEKALMEQTQLPELELLVVGHHGSKSSTCVELLNATKPKAAVISVGEGNYLGHPSDEVLRRLKLFGCSIWRTDLDGTVTFKG